MTRTLAFVFSIAAGLFFVRHSTNADAGGFPNTGLADPESLMIQYARAPRGPLQIPLLPANGASGGITVNTATGAITASVQGLANDNWEVLLIDNAANSSTLPDAADRVINAGRLRAADGQFTLTATVDLRDFQIDRAVVVRAGEPATAYKLIGGSNFFQRLAHGYVQNGDDLRALVAKGRTLFQQERFGGNGRTCGTCHVERNNFTIDAAFIATLPATDPLFVHERNPDLKTGLEDPALLRRLGLFISNPDGLDDPGKKFVLRPAPPLHGVGLQNTAPDPAYAADFTAGNPAANHPERMGWSNDALPLRDFAMGAIEQHLTKTLQRRANTDFRVPSDEELDALAAFQLSIGRAEDFDLAKIKLRTAVGARGMRLYTDTGEIGEPGHKNCNACHFNGGGTIGFSFNPETPNFSPKLDGNPRGFNGTSGTNVNGLADSLKLGIPRDGGFGSLLLPFKSFGNLGDIPGVGVFPVEEFNSMSIVESADTAPYFHNHAVATLEESVAFYGTKAYQSSDSIGDAVAGPIPVKISDDPNDPEVRSIATFLRVLNALENIRSAISALERARRAPTADDTKELAALGGEELKDALQVLSTGSLAIEPDLAVLIARGRLIAVQTALSQPVTDDSLRVALQSLRTAREALVDPASLPASYRN